VVKRILLAAGALALLAFVLEGGEFGTWDLLRQRTRQAELRAAIDSLERDIDSLRRRKTLVETDAETQERIAREAFGYVKENEILYRFVDPSRDTAAARREP
jgi:cell division protein FtsB